MTNVSVRDGRQDIDVHSEKAVSPWQWTLGTVQPKAKHCLERSPQDLQESGRTPLGPLEGARLCDTRTVGFQNWGWIHFCCFKPPGAGSFVTTAPGHGHGEPHLSRTSWVPGALRALHTKDRLTGWPRSPLSSQRKVLRPRGHRARDTRLERRGPGVRLCATSVGEAGAWRWDTREGPAQGPWGGGGHVARCCQSP